MSKQTQIDTTLGALMESEPALHRLTSLKLDAKTRYHAVKLRQLVAAETKHFYEQRNDLVREFGVERAPTAAERATRGPDPIVEVVAGTPRFPEFAKRLGELAAVPVVIARGPVTGPMLDACAEFTGADMLALGPLFTLDEQETTAT